MAFKIAWKKVIPIVALIFAIMFVVTSVPYTILEKGEKSSQVTITLDLGTGEQPYRNKITVGANSTALTVLSKFIANAGKVTLKEGRVQCIIDYCNNNNTVWRFYKSEDTGLGPVETEINDTLESYIVKGGDSIVFRYELI